MEPIQRYRVRFSIVMVIRRCGACVAHSARAGPGAPEPRPDAVVRHRPCRANTLSPDPGVPTGGTTPMRLDLSLPKALSTPYMTPPRNHPVIVRAADGRLPSWAQAGESRRLHMTRVSNLMRDWAVVRSECEEQVMRWAALGHLHDVLRDGDPGELRKMVNGEFADLSGKLLHGPAAASRLAREGVRDDGLLRAVAYHTLGHPELDTAGVALYTADFLDPGRTVRAEWRAALRRRMPAELDAVALEVAVARAEHFRKGSRVLRPETTAFLDLLTERAHG